MVVYFTIVFFIFGTIFGSFFNVVGDRLPRGESIITPASHCPKCGHYLTAIELIPIISYLFQKGKCKNCKCNIPLFHPIFELASGLLFASSYLIFDFTPELVISLTFVSMLLILFVSDMEAMIIPDVVLLFFLITLSIEKIIFYGMNNFLNSLLNGLVALVFLFLIKMLGNFLFKKESMGDGDIKLLFVFGFVLGFPLAIVSVFLGSFVGLPIAILMLKLKREHEIPFGPFLSVGALILLFSRVDFSWIINILS